MRRKNAAHQQDIDDLKRQNEVIQTQSIMFYFNQLIIYSQLNLCDFVQLQYAHWKRPKCLDLEKATVREREANIKKILRVPTEKTARKENGLTRR